jgi:alkylhydroperoxidase family enzyme
MKPLPLSQWDSSLQHVIDDMSGRPLNIHALMAHQPELLNSWWTFRKYIVQGGNLTQRDAELVILRVAAKLNVWYEWGSHVDRGLAAGLSLPEIERVRHGPSNDGWSEQEAILLQAVDELVEQHRITPDTLGLLRARYTQPQVLDIVAIEGVYVSIACMLKTWNPDLDEHIQARLPTHVTRAAFESQ